MVKKIFSTNMKKSKIEWPNAIGLGIPGVTTSSEIKTKKTKNDRIGPDSYENVNNLKRVPRSEEIMNVGPQPHIPTRGFSTIITHTTDHPSVLKIGVDELESNRFKKRKDEKWSIHHKYF